MYQRTGNVEVFDGQTMYEYYDVDLEDIFYSPDPDYHLPPLPENENFDKNQNILDNPWFTKPQ